VWLRFWNGDPESSPGPATGHVFWSWQESNFDNSRCPLSFHNRRSSERDLLGLFCLPWCLEVRRSYGVSLYIMAELWY